MPPNQLEQFVSALRRMGGMYGGAFIGGVLQTDIIEVQAGINVNRAEVVLVGNGGTGYKPGRSTREGTISTQWIDERWNLFVWQFLGQSFDQRRAARGTPAATLRQFQLIVKMDDPDGYGTVAWQLDGCQIWDMQIGHGQGDDTIQRDYPLTWETETPLTSFVLKPGSVVVPYTPGQAITL